MEWRTGSNDIVKHNKVYSFPVLVSHYENILRLYNDSVPTAEIV
jgi:hypothetical protein